MTKPYVLVREVLRAAYAVHASFCMVRGTSFEGALEEFDQYLAREIRKAKAEALRDAADAFEGGRINLEIFTAGSSERDYWQRSNELSQRLVDSLRARAQLLAEGA